MSPKTGLAPASFCLIIGMGTSYGQDLQPETVDDAVRVPSANPFSRPGYTVALDSAPLPSVVAQPVALELRATLVAGDTALVNINGIILSAGEEYQGYRVLSISEGRAVLSNSGERLVLNVYERQLGLDEDNGFGELR